MSQPCDTCSSTARDVRARHVIGGSGPGWTVILCDLCAELPPDPELIPPTVTEVLIRRARPEPRP